MKKKKTNRQTFILEKSKKELIQRFRACLFVCLLIFVQIASAKSLSITFTISMKNPTEHTFQVQMSCEGFENEYIDFKMPVWTPGYYQLLDFAGNVEDFTATDATGKNLTFEKYNANTWRVKGNRVSKVMLKYNVKTHRQFVATPYLDEKRGYIVPTGVFFHPSGMIHLPSKIIVEPYGEWKNIATGLEPVKGEKYTYTADNFDILYDSPLLVGNLEELPSFTVKGVPHYFIGYKMGDFDKIAFINDLKKVIETATDLIGDIPYKHYTFIAIGPGFGGIEHLNSTTLSFNGNSLNTHESRTGMLMFLTHEYFHHYNVKRIRPIELGPFDYDKENRTNMLWVSEGLTVYYQYLIVKRAGLCDESTLLNTFKRKILAFEEKPGRLFQTLAEASYETWEDGPFGRINDEINKTISYYDKGPVVGLFFDFKIRHATNNEKSLDDVMRYLYQHYYKNLNRGFTEEELRKVFEDIAGTSLNDLFDYIYTTKELDYNKYLTYAGYEAEVTPQTQSGGWLGATTTTRNDSVFIKNVEWKSAAWESGLRRGNAILKIDGIPAIDYKLESILKDKNPGDVLQIMVSQEGQTKEMNIKLETRKDRSFTISKMDKTTELQQKIQQSWLTGE